MDFPMMATNSAASHLDRIHPTALRTGMSIRACTNCVRAKAKCSPALGMEVDGSSKCQRCCAMNKECQPSPPMRKRRALKQPTNKTSKLEEKIDGLVNLVKVVTQNQNQVQNSPSPGIQNGSSMDHNTLPDPFPKFPSMTTLRATHPVYQPENSFIKRFPAFNDTPPESISSTTTVTSPEETFYRHSVASEPNAEQAEIYFSLFKTSFIPYLPLIVFPPAMTAAQLHQERPFLWLSIMTVASTSNSQQISMSKEVRKMFGQEAFVEGKKDMDFLMAVLVYVTWDRRHFGFLTMLVQLAIAILYELGLERPPYSTQDPAMILPFEMKGMKKPSRLSRSGTTMEERRLLLGCFLMSAGSSCIRKGGTMRWTRYMDECLKVVEETKEVPSDELLIQLVKVRLIAEKALDVPPAGGSVIGGENTPTIFYMKALDAQLDLWSKSLPANLVENKILLLELHTTRLQIYEPCFNTHTPSVFPPNTTHRLESLYAYLSSNKMLIQTFLSIPPEQFLGFSELIYANMARSLMSMYRLSTFENEEWNLNIVRDSLDVSAVLEETAVRFDTVLLEGPEGDQLDTFKYMARKLRNYRISWEGILAGLLSVENPCFGEELGGDCQMDFLGDDWLNYLFGPVSM